MGDRWRQRRPDQRVLQPHPRDRAQEGRADRGVRRAPRTAAVGEDHRRAPGPGDAGHTPAEGGPIARRPDGRLAAARRRAVGGRADGMGSRRDRPRREPADCRRRAAGCDRGDQRRRGRRGECEAGGLDALEPDGRSVEADHGSEVRDERGPRGCRRRWSSTRRSCGPWPDPAGARDQPDPVPARGRHEPVPSAARREVLLGRGPRCRGAAVGSCREGDRADGGRERCGASGRDWKGPAERATAPCGGEHLPARDARSTYSSGRQGQARPPRCERSERRGPRSTGGGAWSVWRRPPPRPRRWPTTSASRARTRRSGSTSTTTAAPNSGRGQLVIVDEATLADTDDTRSAHRDRRRRGRQGAARRRPAPTPVRRRRRGLRAARRAGVRTHPNWSRSTASPTSGRRHASLALSRGDVQAISRLRPSQAHPRGRHRRDGRRRVRRLASRLRAPAVPASW